jgi:TraM recognition site of TraD and TraG
MFSWLKGPSAKQHGSTGQWPLDTPLLHYSRRDAWTIGHAVQNTVIMGQTGSGKSSGSGRQIALAFLRAGFGGLVLCAKPDEARVWREYCRAAEREQDLVVVGPGSPWRFNPFMFESLRRGPGAAQVESLVALFSSLLELTQRNGSLGAGGRDNDQYWMRACLQMVRNFVNLLVLAEGQLTIDSLYRAVLSAPTSVDQACSDNWKRSSFCFRLLTSADQRPKSESQRRDLGLTADYILLEFPAISEKTRSIIVSTFTSLIDCMNRGILHELFGCDTTFTPESSVDGRVIVCDLSVKEHLQIGQIANVLLKHCWQLAMERRDVAGNPRPVFLFADEAQHFLVSHDMMFLTTCRSAKVATVLATQNLPNVYAALGGGDKGKAEADSILGNLCTKIFHANTDPVTNEWAASVIGRSRQFLTNGNSSSPDDWVSTAIGLRPEGTTSAGFSEAWEYECQPSVFTRLRTGGPENNGHVDGILVQSGKVFRDTGKIWRPVCFLQR